MTTLKDERILEPLPVNARKNATERLRRRAGPEAEVVSVLSREEQLAAELKRVKQEAGMLRRRSKIP